MQDIIENIKFDFTPEFKVTEGEKTGSWINIGGIALTEGVSKNNNKYTFNNLKENDGKNFKWLFGHPDEPEAHVVGAGSLKLEGDLLKHEGKIRNTSAHPDVVEAVKDGFLGPSIHASASKITREGQNYVVEGLSIDGIGLVAFQGVKNATIDYAIAESFDKKESVEPDAQNNEDKDKEADTMSEEKVPEVEQPKEEEKQEEEEVQSEESSKVKALEQEIASLKEGKKIAIVESIVKINPSLKKEDLMKESEDRLELMRSYETKLAEKKDSTAIVETESSDKAEIVENNGDYTMSEKMYSDFNKELRERVR